MLTDKAKKCIHFVHAYTALWLMYRDLFRFLEQKHNKIPRAKFSSFFTSLLEIKKKKTSYLQPQIQLQIDKTALLLSKI